MFAFTSQATACPSTRRFGVIWVAAVMLLLVTRTPVRAQTPLHVLQGDAGEHLGQVVDTAGDINGDGLTDFIASAPGDNIAFAGAGSVRVHSGKDASILWFFYGSRAGNLLGSEVRSAGDVNLDGRPDIIIGDPDFNRALVYSGADGSLLFTLSGDPQDYAGISVSGAGDVDQDGHDDVIVGAGGNFFAGIPPSARVFSGQDGSAIHTVTGSGGFGIEVCDAGDVNRDGHADFAVGALFDSKAYVYSGADASLLWVRTGVANSELGRSIRRAGDLDQDGSTDLLVGAPLTNVGGSGAAGVAQLLSGASGTVLATLSGERANEQFGYSVGGAADANGDGVPDLVVGSPQLDGGEAGTVRLYSGKTAALLYTFRDDRVGAAFGRSVSMLGDVDGDGLAEVGIGADTDDRGGPYAGRVLVCAGSDLFLNALPKQSGEGDLLQLTIREGVPGNPVALAIVAVNGNPMFVLVGGIAHFDDQGSHAVAATVPTGLSGLVVTLRAIARKVPGLAIDSEDEVLSFQ